MAATVSGRWWCAPMPLGRIAALRVLAYAFVPVDVALTAGWVFQRPELADGLYRPLALARLAHLPAPTPTLVDGLRVVLVAAALTALVAVFTRRDRVVRAAGALVALAYLVWMVVAMGYGKVDHDRFAYLVLLGVLPTVAGARLGDRTRTAAAGWALRMTQVAAIATYFLAAVAKIRIGGWGWVNGATLSWAIVRRGNGLSRWALEVPGLLRGAQWGIVAFELASPLVFVLRSEHNRLRVVAGLYAFHLVSLATIGIVFLPHLVALAAFVPLERLPLGSGSRRARSGYSVDSFPGPEPARS